MKEEEKEEENTFELVSWDVVPMSSMLLSLTATAHSDVMSEVVSLSIVSWPGRTWLSANSIDTWHTKLLYHLGPFFPQQINLPLI